MKILIASDSFKGSLSSLKVCNSIEKGIEFFSDDIETEILPLADGGEGTVNSLVNATNGIFIKEVVLGPLKNKVEAHYGILGDEETAVIEMTEASGLTLIPENKRDPAITTTYGTGQLIMSAINRGINKIIIGIGGSATNDCGAGMANAMGVNFFDENGNLVEPCGKNLNNIVQIETTNLDNRIKNINIIVACDVDNPLVGKRGAAEVYGPQKGADKKMIKMLDDNLKHFANIFKLRT
ncbi:glycerate kinase [Halanaerobium sp. MA284_MarDTE_T2]|uniref:glycerate kinase n=1 Tax=Halanaerobium sp. MA284_MarDTE_T2 TaxID=2183913 RepID=UPI000E16D95F|nr:glycerate kinase [Halanaerobium sp. MA284_MarDTE_T2]RCW48633.1 glycerate kinase [Halanaerobium sp. MA284_MarDTE_T2]